MKYILAIFIFLLFFVGCAKEPQVTLKNSFSKLPNFEHEDYSKALDSFINNCKSKKTQKIYGELCQKAKVSIDAKTFFVTFFKANKITSNQKQEDKIMTAYYEAQIRGSLVKKAPYIYPVYETPNDLISLDISSVYPELKKYRLRGRLFGKKVIPYYTREDIAKQKLDAKVICYVDSKIDLFFLEVQGSGRVLLDSGNTMYVGYDNQNGHPYSSIGKYLISNGKIAKKDISLQTIRKYLHEHPHEVDKILNHNKSMVFFKKRTKPASGSLGLVLTPWRSVAVDTKYIPLGSMLYLNAKAKNKTISKIVMAQDTGGAIKGAIRADMFLGYGKKAQEIAGEMIAPLQLWILVPKKEVNSK